MSDGAHWNATFYSFRTSGKYYETGRGSLTEDVFKVFGAPERRAQILKDNGGKYPGLSGPGKDFIFVVIGDEQIDHGYPLLLKPEGSI